MKKNRDYLKYLFLLIVSLFCFFFFKYSAFGQSWPAGGSRFQSTDYSTTTWKKRVHIAGSYYVHASSASPWVIVFSSNGYVGFADGSYMNSTAPFTGGGGGGGSPDLVFNYQGDIYNSTTPYGGHSRQAAKVEISVASYDFYIGSATTDAFSMRFSTKNHNDSTPWATVDTIPVPAGVSSHTATSSGYTVYEGGLIGVSFENVDASDPAGEIVTKIND